MSFAFRRVDQRRSRNKHASAISIESITEDEFFAPSSTCESNEESHDLGEDDLLDQHEDNELNQLDFDPCNFVGREEELERLYSIYGRLCRRSSTTAASNGKDVKLVLIHGYSGTGKSALVDRFTRPLIRPRDDADVATNMGATNETNETTSSSATAFTNSRRQEEPGEVDEGKESHSYSHSHRCTPNHNSGIPKPRRSTHTHISAKDNCLPRNVPGTRTGSSIKPCHYFHGKYDQYTSGGHLSAVVDAFSQFFQQLAADTADIAERERIVHRIKQRLDHKRRGLLCRMIPHFGSLLKKQQHDDAQDVIETASQVSDSYFMGHTETGSYLHTVMSNSNVTQNALMQRDTGDSSWAQIVYGLKTIIKIICRVEKPLVFYLDDLQWADELSMTLIADILVDSSIQNMLLIGSYRSNEVEGNPQHPLNTALLQWKDTGKAIHEIHLDNLNKRQVSEFLAQSLRLETRKTRVLAKTLHTKTGGNILYIRQSIDELRRRDILKRNIHSMQWEWDEQRVSAELSLAANIVDLITAKLHELPLELQEFLMIASFLRSTFSQAVLEVLIERENDYRKQSASGSAIFTSEDTDLDDYLNRAVQEGLLEEITNGATDQMQQHQHQPQTPQQQIDTQSESSSQEEQDSSAISIVRTRYRFVHDRIKQAAMSLIPSGSEADYLRARMGMYLMELASHPVLGQEWMWFVAADQFEEPEMTSMVGNEERRDLMITSEQLIQLNLIAGQMAVRVSAFVPAAKYLNRALKCLQLFIPDPWKTCHGLTLEVHRALADTELCLGNYEAGSIVSNTILEHANTVSERVMVNVALANAFARARRHQEALKLTVKSMRMLHKFPARNHLLLAIRDLSSIKKYLDKHTDEDILNLPIIPDGKIKYTMSVLSLITSSAFFSGQSGTTFLSFLRQIKMTFKHGLTAESACALASLGSFFMNLTNDPERGTRVSLLSQKVFDVTKSKQAEAFFVLSRFPNVTCWRESPHASLLHFRRGQMSGMETGDLKNAYLCWSSSLLMAYVLGMPLQRIYDAGKNLLAQGNHYRLSSVTKSYQFVQNMLGHLMDYEDPATRWEDDANVPQTSAMDPSEHAEWGFYYWRCLQLATYFGELEMGKRMIQPCCDVSKMDNGFMTESIKLFHSSLIYSRLARKTKQRKYLKRAKQMVSKMSHVTKTRGGNNLHRYLLMKADAMAASGKEKIPTVKREYDNAIACCARSGYVHDTALGYELAAEYFLSVQEQQRQTHPGSAASAKKPSSNKKQQTNKDRAKASSPQCITNDIIKDYLSNSVSLYDEWGAKAKVGRMLSKYLTKFPELASLVEDSSKGKKTKGHTAEARLCVSAAHKMFDKINLDVL